MKILPLLLLSSLVACSGSKKTGTSPGISPSEGIDITLAGQVLERSGTNGVSSTIEASAVAVTASYDFNADGVIGDDEKSEATTDAEGRFNLAAKGGKGRTLVVAFQKEGFSPLFKTVLMQDAGSIRLDATLDQLAPVNCVDTICNAADQSVEIRGVAIASGYAKAFNPVDDIDTFPGDFSESNGYLLKSTVFAAFELKDAQGVPIHQLPQGQTAKIRIKIPKDTWNTVADATPGNEQIDVPMYYFDEVKGTWVAEGSGWIEDAGGAKVVPAELTNIQNGSYSGLLFSVAEVSHFSWWNHDQIEQTTCVELVVVNADGTPVPNAKVVVSGETYTGTSDAVTTSAEGKILVDVKRSGSDSGGTETFSATVIVPPGSDPLDISKAPTAYRVDHINSPSNTASTALALDPNDSGCEERELRLDGKALLAMQAGTVDGAVAEALMPIEPLVPPTVISEAGGMTSAAQVDAYAQATSKNTKAFFEDAPLFQTTIGEDGRFRLNVLKTDSFTLKASQVMVDENSVFFLFEDSKKFYDFPAESVELRPTLTNCIGPLIDVTLNPQTNTVSWEPNVPLAVLSIFDANTGTVKFNQMYPNGVESPLTITPIQKLAATDLVILVPTQLVPYKGYFCLGTAK